MTEAGNVQESPPTTIAIRIRNPDNKYQLGGLQEKDLILREAMGNLLKMLFKRFHRTPLMKVFGRSKDVVMK